MDPQLVSTAIKNLLSLLGSFLGAIILAGCMYLASKVVNSAKLENFFEKPTRWIKLTLALGLGTLIFTPANFLYNRFFVFLLQSDARALVKGELFVEGVLLVFVVKYIYDHLE